jgi:hypothetical protein
MKKECQYCHHLKHHHHQRHHHPVGRSILYANHRALSLSKKIKLDNNEKLERKRTYDQVKRKRKTSWQKTATG